MPAIKCANMMCSQPPVEGSPYCAQHRPTNLGVAAKAARQQITWLFLGGIVASVIGIVIAVSESPTTTTIGSGVFAVSTTSGSQGEYVVGLVIAALGSCMCWVALTAWGCLLALRACQRI